GMSEDDVRKDAASQFTLTTYIEQEADIKQPSDEELKSQYDQLVAQQEQAGGQQGEVPPFEDVKDQLADQATSQQQGEAATKLADDLEKKGDVTINI
ncbi:MAG: SurA, partial [Brachybacterium sp.]